MTNADKYLKDGVDMYELISTMDTFYMSGYSYHDNLTYFFNHEVKPTLTEDEKVILRNLPTKYEFIGRNNHSTLQLSKISKIKEDCYCDEEIDELYNHLFQFIKPRRRI